MGAGFSLRGFQRGGCVIGPQPFCTNSRLPADPENLRGAQLEDPHGRKWGKGQRAVAQDRDHGFTGFSKVGLRRGIGR